MSQPSGERGAVTAETAVALPALGLVLVLCVWVIGAVLLQLRCVDAARAGARVGARGEPASAVRAEAGRVAPKGATVRISADGADVVVDVRLAVGLPGPWSGAVPALDVHGRAVAAVEPGVAVR
jgi:hypothetical protein